MCKSVNLASIALTSNKYQYIPDEPNSILRGAVVEWLEQLDYGAESRLKVVSSRLGFAMRRLENSLCRPSSEWVPFSRIREG